MSKFLTKDVGLLIIRVGIGIMFFFHGYPKLMGGPEKWQKVGSAMENLGITFGHTFWGLMAALTECLGGVFLALGVFFSPVTLLLAFTMVVATSKHIAQGDTFPKISHAAEAGILFIGLFFTGPGKFRLPFPFR